MDHIQTPRTDAACGVGNFIHCVDDDFARGLERELAAANDALKRATTALEFYANPEIYKPSIHGIAFDRGDLSFFAKAALQNKCPACGGSGYLIGGEQGAQYQEACPSCS